MRLKRASLVATSGPKIAVTFIFIGPLTVRVDKEGIHVLVFDKKDVSNDIERRMVGSVRPGVLDEKSIGVRVS